MTTPSESAIPQKYVDFCKAVTKLAAELDLNNLGLNFIPGYHDAWRDQIVMRWDSGRHGEDMTRLTVTSTVTLRTEVVL